MFTVEKATFGVLYWKLLYNDSMIGTYDTKREATAAMHEMIYKLTRV